MSLNLSSILLILFLTTKHLNCSEDNVWETYETNSDFNEKIPEFSESDQRLYESGKRRYEVMAREETNYGNCWRNAIQSLHTNCKQLNDEIQSRLALSFANCFLERAGMETYPCGEHSEVKHCLKGMTDRAFNSYTEFFTHTQSVCFYLRSELWQQKTESTIDRLTQTATRVKHTLEDASQQLDHLNGLQESAISSQSKLNDELMSARNTIHEFKASSAEQRFIVKEILDRFIRLQDFVLIEISYGYSLLFFFIALIVVYFMTTPVRTSDSRLWLFVLLILNLIIERMIASYSAEDQLIGLKSTSILINERVWMSRRIMLSLMALIFLWFAITYKNYGLVNYSILSEHTLRLDHIQNQLNQMLIQSKVQPKEQNILKFMDQTDKEFSSDNDSDFTDDSDYSTDGSDATNASIDTCSTVAVVTSSSTNSMDKDIKSENKENNGNSKTYLSAIQALSPRTYDLRPRKSITYTKNGIIDESVHEFTAKVKLSETITKINNQRIKENYYNFLSSDDD